MSLQEPGAEVAAGGMLAVDRVQRRVSPSFCPSAEAPFLPGSCPPASWSLVRCPLRFTWSFLPFLIQELGDL